MKEATVPPRPAFHTSQPETPAVHHNNSACSEGKKIKSWHRLSDLGHGRRLCEVCAKLNAEGKRARRSFPVPVVGCQNSDRSYGCDHTLWGAGEPEGRALGVAADHPALARVDDLAAECAHPFDGGSEVGDRDVGEREAVAGAWAALVQPEHNPLVLGLPAAPLLGSAALQRRLQQLLPEASRAFRLVGG